LEYFSKQILIRGGRNLSRAFITIITCVMITSIFSSGDMRAGTIYEYVDRDGSIILTDSPPPGVNARPLQTYQDMTESEKENLEKEKTSEMQKYRESGTKRKEKEEKIRAARTEYEQAIKEEERYRSNKNQARGYAQQQHWIKMLEEQSKEIEEKKKKLQELESAP
jgi:hypothetical protein